MECRSVFLLLLICVAQSWCHLCLIFPEQRGDMDITRSGSSTCFRHGSPCGGQAPETPGVTPYMGGQQMWIKIQQNYNHYEVGFPGYMDIAIAPLNSLDFQMLAFTPDYYVHAQDHVKNFTTIVVLPNIDCDHCVIRARYNPHKPGETIFYQCADIKIKKSDGLSQTPPMSLPPLSQSLDPEYRTVRKKMDVLRYRNRFGPKMDKQYIFGLSYNPFDKAIVNFMNISLTTGYPKYFDGVDLVIIESKLKNDVTKRKSTTRETEKIFGYICAAIGAINSRGDYVGLFHDEKLDDDLAFNVMVINLHGENTEFYPIKALKAPINAILPYSNGSFYTFSIAEGSDAGDYAFELGTLIFHPDPKDYDPWYQYTPIVKTQENLYINFQWAEYDPIRHLVYVLMGNENSPDKLQARLYTFSAFNMSIAITNIDVDQFTFSSMHLDKRTGKLYAVSPGLFYSTNVQWHLIEVDPLTGKSESVFQIASFGYFARYYGGSIFNGISPEGILYHVFRLADTDADVIAAIDISKKTVTFSEITNLRSVHNLALVNMP
ncbi:uncharacterized protein LOC134687376 [Mytilus trossulus]|uniref:uncharacterized protein LOC134687376 n=1 Tax=Mytilus trossulus TaxID=6551 RepID=UPI0030060E86